MTSAYRLSDFGSALCQRRTFLKHYSFLIFVDQHLGYVYILLTFTKTVFSHTKSRNSRFCNEINSFAIWRKEPCLNTYKELYTMLQQLVKIYNQIYVVFTVTNPKDLSHLFSYGDF